MEFLYKMDIRIIKTQRNIKNAFRQLLAKKNYEDITVQNIIDIAEINRTTFYKHYANKDALASQLINEFKQHIFIPTLNKRFSVSAIEFSQDMPELLLRFKDELRLLTKIETPKLHLEQDMYLIIKNKYIKELKKQIKKYPDININAEYQGHIFASVSLASISYSINSEHIHDPKEILDNMKMVFEIIMD